jgi:uncharacterized protein
MSQENVELVRGFYKHYERTGEANLSTLDPEIAWDASRRTFDPGVYHGQEGVREMLSHVEEQWATMRIEPLDFVVAGDDVIVVSIRLVGVGKASGVETTANAAHLWTLRDGKIVRHTGFQTMAEALEAAGLSE